MNLQNIMYFKIKIYLLIISIFFTFSLYADSDLNQEEKLSKSEYELEDKKEATKDEISKDSKPLPQITVTSVPAAPSLLQFGEAVSILQKEELIKKSEISIGETLRNEPGVSSSYSGPGTSRPIIRGNAGERVRILKNGIGSLDVSNTAEDHQVSINPLSADSIEILRGPETLLYGSSAIGGVVNVIDGSIPSKNIGADIQGEYNIRTQTVNEELTGALKLEGQIGKFNWNISGLTQESSEVDIPGFSRSSRIREIEVVEDESRLERGSLSNSETKNTTASAGASYVFNDGYFGLSLTTYNSKYGIPGEIEVSEEEDEEEGGEFIELEQLRLDSRGEFRNINDTIQKVKFAFGISNYDHKEVDGEEVASRFANDAFEGRVELMHTPIVGLSGTLGSQVEYSEFSAIGDSVFVPSSKRLSSGLFLFEELPLTSNEDLKLVFGGRLELVSISPENDFRDRNFAPFSLSSGFLWDVLGNSKYIAGLSVAYTERAPSATELYADGVHFGRRIAEFGIDSLSNENSLGIDLTLRKNTGLLTGGLALFAQEFGNYINLESTGRQLEGFNEFAYNETRARLMGFEAESRFHIDRLLGIYSHDFNIGAQLDYTHARDTTNNNYLPRIPPLKTILSATYGWKDMFSSSIEGVFVAAQRNIGEGELPTDAYQMLNANIDFTFPYLIEKNCMIYARAINLTNEEARVHSSFIKDFAPLPGRSFLMGVRGTF